MTHPTTPTSDAERGAAAATGRDAPAWLGVALVAGSWTWIQQRYLPLGDVSSSDPLTWFLGALGYFMLAGGLLLIGMTARRHGGGARALLLGAAVLVCTLLLDVGLARLEATYQRVVPPFSYFAWLVAKATGASVSVHGTDLLFDAPQGAMTFTPTWGLVGFRPLLLFWAAGLLLLFQRDARRFLGSFVRLVLVPMVFVGLRYSWKVLQMSDANKALGSKAPAGIAIFWEPWSLSLVLILSAVAMIALERRQAIGWNPLGGGRRILRPAGLALFAGLCLGSAYSWQDPGVSKAGRVLVDERLTSYWEPAGRLLDKTRYGDFSAYSFAAMVEHLSRHFTVTVNSTQKYTPDYLANFDVFIVKTPEEAKSWSPDEVEAIQDWVLAGGGLFAISDHTDLNGMSSVLNPLVGPFGIEFRFDATASSDTGGFDYWHPHVIAEHPVSEGLGLFEFMTPCSIDTSFGARPVMTVNQSVSTGGDYARSSNFGGLTAEPSRAHGMMVVAAAAEWDQGRVLAFSDSTVFSSFAYYLHSHSDFVLRGVTWLNRERSAWYWLKWAFALAGAAGAFLALRSLGQESGGLLGAVLLGGAGVLVGAKATGEVAAGALVTPPPVEDNVRVGFVEEGGFVRLPAVLGTQPLDLAEGENLMTFIQTPQRLGMETTMVPRDLAVLRDLDVLVLLNPDVEAAQRQLDGEANQWIREHTPQGGEWDPERDPLPEELKWHPEDWAPPKEWVDAVHSWVQEGGRLVVLARAGHWTDNCRFSDDHAHMQADAYLKKELDWQVADSHVPDTRIEVADEGEGRIVFVLGSEEFDTGSMGHCMAFPGRDERLRYETAYWIFETLLGLDMPERKAYQPNSPGTP